MATNGEIEAVIDPDRIIIDAHHHLHGRFEIPAGSPLSGQEERVGIERQFLVDDYAAAVEGCNVVASVAIEAGGMYRRSGPDHLKPVGETEYLNGQAAMAASGAYGPCQVAAAIMAKGDLMAGSRVREILEAHKAAAPDRFRGVRQTAGWDKDPSVFGWMYPFVEAEMYAREDFREGFSVLQSMGLVFDAFILSPQMDDICSLARAFPGAPIVVNHLAVPVGVGRFAGRLEEEFPNWRAGMARMAQNENVLMKIGGLGSLVSEFPSFMARPPFTSQQLADEWRPYVETAIELFGADRCMFNSDLPTNRSGTFRTLSNAYKHITADCSENEKQAIFAGTAARVYDLDLSALADERMEGAGE